MPNKVGSATIITSYNPISQDYGPQNLKNNLNNRTTRWDLPPLKDATGAVATTSSCFRVKKSEIIDSYVFGLDHGFSIIQNGALLVQDVYLGGIGSETITVLG